jgi:uncharacterized protein (DUF362 family)
MSKVSVLKTKPETILQDYAKLMNLVNYKKTLPKTNEIILKLNLSWSLYYPACSTEPWQLEGVIKTLRQDNYKKIVAAENKTVVTDINKGIKENKWASIMRKYNVPFIPLTKSEWVNYKPKTEMLAFDKIFNNTHKIPKFFIGKNIIHLPTLKVHGHTAITASIKNAFGGLITSRRHHCHAKIHEVLVDLLQIQKEIHPKIFAVIDGTVCGDGKGPRTMIPKIKDYILASEDQVAIDAISAKMMGYDPMKIKFIKIAHDKGLGIGDPKQIDIIGEDISNVNFKFTTKKSPVIFWDQMFRKGPLSFVEPLLFHTGLFNLCILGSMVYHDYLWYPTIGKIRINKFMKTEWGRLFKKY